VVLAAGCGSSSDGPTVNDGGVTPVGAAACAQSAPLYCEKLFACAPAAGEELYGTVEACKIADAADCRRLGALPDTSPRSIEAWAACNKALGAQTCDEWNFGPPVEGCRSPGGARKLGQVCYGGSQCSSNFCKYTVVDPTTGATSECGVCAAPPGVGESCDYTNYCDVGLRCAQTDPQNSSAMSCIRPVAEGAACSEQSDSPCQGRLVCLDGRCARPLKAGTACTSSIQCDGELICVNGSCGPPLTEDAACTPDDDNCGPGLGCRAGVCTKLLPDGADCNSSEECLGFCDTGVGSASGKCVGGISPRARAGEACVQDAATGMGLECVYQAFCDPATSRCVLRKPDGAPCSDDSQCLGWLRCDAGKCSDPIVPMCK